MHGIVLVTDTRVVSWLKVDCTPAPCHGGVRVKLYVLNTPRWGGVRDLLLVL